MEIKAIAEKIKKYTGVNYIIRPGVCNTHFAEFSTGSWEEYAEISNRAYRIKSVKVETHFNTKTVWVYTADDWKTVKEYNDAVRTITEGFWEVLHNFGRDAADAYFKEHEAEYIRLGI